MITRKMRLSMAMLTIVASMLTTGNIKADEKNTTKETNTITNSKYANKAVADNLFYNDIECSEKKEVQMRRS